jgi:diguanylate cyclase (GGDEF)-like protein
MQYDFSSASLKLVDFIDAYTTCISISSDVNTVTTTGLYEKVFHILERAFEEEELMSLYQVIAEYKISKEIPYAIISNEIYGLKNLLISNFSTKTSGDEIVKVLTLFQKISNKVAHLYLLKYIEKLISLNNVRLSSISDLVEKNIISHYESHLIWLTELAQHIKNAQKKDFPELDASTCEFGKWLQGDAKQIISNNSKYKNIVTIHNNLHLFAVKIFNILELGEYHVLITYLEKCELISLSIGTELALLDQILINKQITKDTLTGALNRHGLRSVFESQYELALATSNSFIVAMCDLDFFKNVNDTYGHVAGDRVLKLFVDTVKENIRNSDVIIRYGGEEFVIMLPTIQKLKGYEVLNKICAEFAKTSLNFEGEEISSTVSIGMVEIQPDYLFKNNFLDDYLMIADKKLYQAKENGRNRVVL